MKNVEISFGLWSSQDVRTQLEDALDIDNTGVDVDRTARAQYERAWETKRAEGITVIIGGADMILYPQRLVQILRLCHDRKIRLSVDQSMLGIIKDALTNELKLSQAGATRAMEVLFPNGEFLHNT
jgi:hypothetical protein